MKTTLVIPVLALLATALGSCSTSRHRAHESAPAKFEVRVELVEAPTSTVAGWIDAHGTKPKVVSSADAASVLFALRREGTVVTRPKIVVAAGATAEISRTGKVSYVREFTVDQQPIMATIEESERIRTTPAVAPGDRIDVEFSAEMTTVRKPMREMKVRKRGTSNELSLQVPETMNLSFHGTITLAPDEAALVPLSAASGPGDDRVRIAVVRIRRIA